MRLKKQVQQQSPWESLKSGVVDRTTQRGTVRSGLIAAASAVGVAALSAVVSAIRQKNER
jgi:hypothetical protein